MKWTLASLVMAFVAGALLAGLIAYAMDAAFSALEMLVWRPANTKTAATVFNAIASVYPILRNMVSNPVYVVLLIAVGLVLMGYRVTRVPR